MTQMLSGTPPIVALAPLAASLDVWHNTDLQMVREKSVAQSELFLRLVATQCLDPDLSLASPQNSELRGSHLAYCHPQGYAVMQALIADNVIGDFRDPDVMRFGFTPLYTRFVDVWDAATALCRVLNTASWSDPRFQRRATVT
jgi:kynureninase